MSWVEQKMTKSLFVSKTFWVNAITAAVAMLTGLAASDIVQANPSLGFYITAAVSVLNIGLRIVTYQPVEILK